MHPPILNLNDIELSPLPERYLPSDESAAQYQQSMAHVSKQLGSQKLGYRMIGLKPGMRASPFHSHRVNEELFFIVAGEGQIRLGDETFPVRAGDIIACPPGGPDTAHQIFNNSADELRYLALSTVESPEICEYPDSGKFMVMHNGSSVRGSAERFHTVARKADAVDYWDGE
jgi:uncharacterized cupin superfamily protein